MIMIVAMKRSSDILCLTRENEMSNSHSESQCNRYLNCTERSLASLVQVHWIMNTLPLPTGMARQLFQFQAMPDNLFWIPNTPTVLIFLQSRLRMFLQMVITYMSWIMEHFVWQDVPCFLCKTRHWLCRREEGPSCHSTCSSEMQ